MPGTFHLWIRIVPALPVSSTQSLSPASLQSRRGAGLDPLTYHNYISSIPNESNPESPARGEFEQERREFFARYYKTTENEEKKVRGR